MLGVIALGQSPRSDLERAFALESPDARVRVTGLLDGLAAHEIEDLARRRTDVPVLVRLMDGSTRRVGVEWLHPLAERVTRELVEEYARVIVLACVEDFPEVPCEVPVLVPGRVLPREVGQLSPRLRIGIVTPVESQAPGAAARWLADGFLPTVTWASPSRHMEILRAARVMKDADVDVVLLDALGHEARYAEEFAHRCKKPVVTTQGIMARAASALIMSS